MAEVWVSKYVSKARLLLAVIFIIISSCWDKYKILAFRWNTKKVRRTCRTCAALAYLLTNKVKEGRLVMLGKCSTEWEINSISGLHCRAMGGRTRMFHRDVQCKWTSGVRANSAVDGWNSRLNRSIGQEQPNNVFLLVHKSVSWYVGNWSGRKLKSANKNGEIIRRNKAREINNVWKCKAVWVNVNNDR